MSESTSPPASDSWSFLHISDMQPGSPRSYRYRQAHGENWATAHRQLLAERDVDLLLVGGDLTRDGYVHDLEYDEVKAKLDALPYPYHAIPGNMDVGNKAMSRQPARDPGARAWSISEDSLNRFAGKFGQFPWSFTHRNVRFSGCYAAVIDSGLPAETRFWNWLEKDLPEVIAAQPAANSAAEPTDHHVVLMHYPLFIDQPDEPTWDLTNPEQYTAFYFSIDQPHRARILDAFRSLKVDIVLTGHIHCRRPAQVFDGIRHYKCAGVAFHQWADRWPDGDPRLGYYRFDVTPAGIPEPTFIPLDPESTSKEGYGPGGHPLAENRDFSLAWEKA